LRLGSRTSCVSLSFKSLVKPVVELSKSDQQVAEGYLEQMETQTFVAHYDLAQSYAKVY
jgi:hypothetical protein